MKRKNFDLTTTNSRKKLKPRKEPYWQAIGKGIALGFYKMPKGGSWVVRRRLDGKYVFDTIGDEEMMSHADAMDRARRETTASGTSKFTVQDAIDKYLDAFEKRGGKDIQSAESRLTDHPLARIKLDELTTFQVAGWRDGLVNAALKGEAARKNRATVNKIHTYLRAALNHAVDLGMTKNRDFQIVKPFKGVDKAKLRFLSVDEAEAVLANCNSTQFRDLCEAALLTGARYGELAALRVRDFDDEQGTIRLSGAKTDSPRTVGLNASGMRLFRKRVQGAKKDDFIFTNTSGEPWGKSHQKYPMDQAVKRAGIEKCSFHDLRSTYGSWLAKAGVPLLNISKALGHKDTRITSKHYAHLVEQDQIDIVRNNLPKLGQLKKVVG